MGCSTSSDMNTGGQPYPKQAYHQQQGAPNQQPMAPHQQRPVANVTPQQQGLPMPQPQTVPSAPPVKSEQQTGVMTKQVDVNKETLQRYIDLQKQTVQYESKNILPKFKAKKDALHDINTTVDQLSEHYKKCVAQTAKEKADVDNMPNVKSFFKDQSQYEASMSKEQQEYLDAVNEQEVAEKDLHGVKQQKEQLEQEVAALKPEGEKLEKIYQEQDELLASIFNGKYGSDLEYKLESDLDVLLDRKQRIGVALNKWQNGNVLLNHACTQLAFAVQRWQQVLQIQPTNLQMRYRAATETRNNLIAASQNIGNAHRYLNNIDFPYCKPAEMDTLNKACNNIYTDMQSHDRHQHAMQCYSITHRRTAALIQWFDSVIKNTISKDFDVAKKQTNETEIKLRKERLRLIKEKIRETMGENVDLPPENDIDIKPEENEPEPELVGLMEADRVSLAEDLPQGDVAATSEGLSAPKDEKTSAPTPLPLSELAPPPSMDDLFGNVEDLKKQHEKEMVEFNKVQEMNKARVEQGLQEKLRERKSRRARQETNQ